MYVFIYINIWRLVNRCSLGRTSPPNSRCQFTCFPCNFTCFTGGKAQTLTAERGACLCQGKCERWEQVNDMNSVALRYAVYLLYWYKSTNTDAAAALRCAVYLLYWYKSANTDAAAALSNAKAETLLLSKDRKAAEDKLARYAHILERPTADPHTYPPYIPLIHTPHTISSRGMRTS